MQLRNGQQSICDNKIIKCFSRCFETGKVNWICTYFIWISSAPVVRPFGFVTCHISRRRCRSSLVKKAKTQRIVWLLAIDQIERWTVSNVLFFVWTLFAFYCVRWSFQYWLDCIIDVGQRIHSIFGRPSPSTHISFLIYSNSMFMHRWIDVVVGQGWRHRAASEMSNWKWLKCFFSLLFDSQERTQSISIGLTQDGVGVC